MEAGAEPLLGAKLKLSHPVRPIEVPAHKYHFVFIGKRRVRYNVRKSGVMKARWGEGVRGKLFNEVAGGTEQSKSFRREWRANAFVPIHSFQNTAPRGEEVIEVGRWVSICARLMS